MSYARRESLTHYFSKIGNFYTTCGVLIILHPMLSNERKTKVSRLTNEITCKNCKRSKVFAEAERLLIHFINPNPGSPQISQVM